MDFKISKENLDALLQYLMTRPFAEVEGGVVMLRSLEPLEPVEEKKEEKSNK